MQRPLKTSRRDGCPFRSNFHPAQRPVTRRPAVVATISVAMTLAAAACSPTVIGHGPSVSAPSLTSNRFVAPDGYTMRVRVWRPKSKPRAIMIGLHGMNDYSFSFEMPAKSWAEAGIMTYAYDQRGFGANRRRGIWPGTDALIADLRTFVKLVRARHPKLPIFVTGVSMGGGVTMAALAGPGLPEIDGAILVAPAVWARATIPLAYRIPLTIGAYTLPAYTLSARKVGRRPTDNIAALRAAGRDSNVLKKTRVDAIWGVVNVMDRAYTAAPNLTKRVLFLYGAKDQIIPSKPVLSVIRRLPPGRSTVAIYENGWHWLYRDLQRSVVHEDVIAWTTRRPTGLPSGADREKLDVLKAGSATAARPAK